MTAARQRSMWVAGLSTVVEWYDFTLYLYFATVFSRVFFGGGEQALLVTLAGFAVSYLMRPLGALCFGHLGDRLGRRWMLLASMALMAAAMLATALLPTAATAGATAGVLLLVLRCVMAFSVGGEYTGVVAYLLESAPVRRRGLVTSLASAASEVGALLAVAISALTVALLPAAQLDSWGWRIPFFVGAALALVIPGRTLGHARIAGVRAPAARGQHSGYTASPRTAQPSASGGTHLRDLGAGVDHLLRGHHLCACIPARAGPQ